MVRRGPCSRPSPLVDNGACDRGEILAGGDELRRVERWRLCRQLKVSDFALTRRRFAEYIAASDFGVVPFNRGDGIDQDHVALVQRLSMRVGSRFA